jgi:hypothetical protein
MIDRREEVDSNLEDLRRWSLQNDLRRRALVMGRAQRAPSPSPDGDLRAERERARERAMVMELCSRVAPATPVAPAAQTRLLFFSRVAHVLSQRNVQKFVVDEDRWDRWD